jgi:hypothetical protein
VDRKRTSESLVEERAGPERQPRGRVSDASIRPQVRPACALTAGIETRERRQRPIRRAPHRLRRWPSESAVGECCAFICKQPRRANCSSSSGRAEPAGHITHSTTSICDGARGPCLDLRAGRAAPREQDSVRVCRKVPDRGR